MHTFFEKDRLLFLEICGVRQLSQCVKAEAQTENLRPCPPMQDLVRSLVPYIQRFLYHHDELADVYPELMDKNIGGKIKRLYFGQVSRCHLQQFRVSLEQDYLTKGAKSTDLSPISIYWMC